MNDMDLYGIIGYPLGHSFSPGYFNRKFEDEQINATYRSYPIATVESIADIIRQNTNLKGLNVTIPYKESVIPLLDETDNTAQLVGAVNCISINDGVLKGYNTDVIGFQQSLLPLLEPHYRSAIILGTGGASKAVQYVLDHLAIPFILVSRTGQRHTLPYSALVDELMASHQIIINTTPLGMYPDVHTSPHIPYDTLTNNHLLYDLVYNPEETEFLKKGKEKGAVIKNGLEMLQLQAEACWDIWNMR
jgi:shikimate dehydrogenase